MWKHQSRLWGVLPAALPEPSLPERTKPLAEAKPPSALLTSTHQWDGIATMLVEQRCLYFTPISHLEDGEKETWGNKSRVSPSAHLLA